MLQYTEAQEAMLVRELSAGKTYDEIATRADMPFDAESLRSKARRMRAKDKWPDNPLSVRELPNGKPGRPPNRERPAQLGARLSVDVHNALKALVEASGLKVGVVVEEAIWRAATVAKLAEDEPRTFKYKPDRRARLLVCTPRMKQLSSQVTSQTRTLATELAALDGISVSAVTASAIQALLLSVGHKLTERNV